MNRNMFNSAMAQQGYTQKMLAKAINMSESTMTRKVKTGSFTLPEAQKIVDVLHIERPGEIFFAE